MLKVFQKLLLSISLLFSIGAQCQTLPIQPSNNELPASLGKAGNAPVLKALAVLIPSKYTVAVKTSVPENTILKWEASPNWFAVLSDAVATANLKMTMSEKDKKIVIYKDALPMVASSSSETKKSQIWKLEASDLTIANTFTRWAKSDGWQVRWDADKHILVEAPDTIKGTFEEAIATVLTSPGVESSFPLEVCFYKNTPPLARITRRGEQECK